MFSLFLYFSSLSHTIVLVSKVISKFICNIIYKRIIECSLLFSTSMCRVMQRLETRTFPWIYHNWLNWIVFNFFHDKVNCFSFVLNLINLFTSSSLVLYFNIFVVVEKPITNRTQQWKPRKLILLTVEFGS